MLRYLILQMCFKNEILKKKGLKLFGESIIVYQGISKSRNFYLSQIPLAFNIIAIYHLINMMKYYNP